MPRYFTLREARASLPEVGKDIRAAVQANAKYREAERALMETTQRILMRGGISVDTRIVQGWKSQKDSGAEALKNAMGRMEERGVLVKDLDTGLVDFPTLYRGQEVYLCWRMDEDDIDFWHGVKDGFAGRKLIDGDFLSNHKGEAGQ